MAQRPGRPLRAAFINDWWTPDNVGGAEQTASECANYLAQNGFDVSAFVPADTDSTHRDGPTLVRRVARPAGRSSVHTGRLAHAAEFLSTRLDPRSAFRVAREVATFRPDVVVVHNAQRMHSALHRALRLAGVDAPVVRVVHDLSDTCWLRTRFRGGESCEQACLPCRAKRSVAAKTQNGAVSGVVANSRYVAGMLEAAGLFPDVPTVVGYPGLNRALGLRRGESHRAGTPDRPPTFGFIGRVTAEKGVLVAVDAMAVLRKSLPTARLVVAGGASGAIQAELRERAGRLGVPLEILGHTPITDFADQVDVALVPSLWPEPFGRVALELAALGVPAAVSDRGGLPEAVRAIRDARVIVVSEVDAGSLAGAALSLYGAAQERRSTGSSTPMAAPQATSLEEALLTLVLRALDGLTDHTRAEAR